MKPTTKKCTLALELLDDDHASSNSMSPIVEPLVNDESYSGSRSFQVIEKFAFLVATKECM